MSTHILMRRARIASKAAFSFGVILPVAYVLNLVGAVWCALLLQDWDRSELLFEAIEFDLQALVAAWKACR